MKALTLNISLMTFTAFIAAFLCEVVVRKAAPQILTGSWYVQTDTGLLVNKSSGSSTISHDSAIIRYSFYYPHLRDTPIKENGGVKILILGESFTFGWLLNKEDTTVEKIQRFCDAAFGINQFQFLNASKGGWGTADYVAYVEDFGDIIEPELIIVFINHSDIDRSLKYNTQFKDDVLYTLADENGLSLDRHKLDISQLKKVINAIPFYEWLLNHSHFVQLMRNTYMNNKFKILNINDLTSHEAAAEKNDSNARVHADNNSTEVRLAKALFLRLKEWADSHEALLIVTTTGYHNPSPSEAETSNKYTKAFMSIAEEYFQSIDVPFIDVSPYIYSIMHEDIDKFRIIDDHHPNSLATDLISKSTWKYIIKDQLSTYLSTH